MLSAATIKNRVDRFCAAYSLRVPILMAPMAGSCPPALAIAVARAGGMGACGALMMEADAIQQWASDVRAHTNGAFQCNLWIPDPAPVRDPKHEEAVRDFLAQFGPEVPEEAGDQTIIDFDAQCEALLAAGPAVISSIMGLYPADFVREMKTRNIKWFAAVTTVAEALEAEAAGADVIVAQGMEAGGHRGAFNGENAENQLIGLISLLPAVVDAVNVPVVATGGIADGRGVAAALVLGASGVQIGTALLRTPEAGIASPWADAIDAASPEDTVPTRAFSGRLGRSIRTTYVETANSKEAPRPAPYPVQRGLTGPMKAEAQKEGDVNRMQTWAGQSAGLARNVSAETVVNDIWEEVEDLLFART